MGKRTSEYETWAGMRARCNNPNHVRYYRYGGRGIVVCKEWDSFKTFHTDMGDRPFPDAQIDRIDNDGNYEPSNCRWVTPAFNNQHRSSTKLSMEIANEIRLRYKNEKISHRQLAKEYNVGKAIITAILNNKKWKNYED